MDDSSVPPQKIGILFVCLGNICRSPAAEGIMKELVEKYDCSAYFHIDSAGTYGGHQGELPDSRMRMHGSLRGYDFCSRSRQFKVSDFDKYDYIVVMDDQNYQNVRSMAITDTDEDKIYTITDFAFEFSSHDCVPDPYYGGADGFELVLDLLEDCCEGLFRHIVREYDIPVNE